MKVLTLAAFLLLSLCVSAQRLAVNEKDKYTGRYTVETEGVFLKKGFSGRAVKVSARRVDSLYGLFLVIRESFAFSITEGQNMYILLESGEVVKGIAVTNSLSKYLPYTRIWLGDAGYLLEKTDLEKLAASRIESFRLEMSDHTSKEFDRIPRGYAKDLQTGIKKLLAVSN